MKLRGPEKDHRGFVRHDGRMPRTGDDMRSSFALRGNRLIGASSPRSRLPCPIAPQLVALAAKRMGFRTFHQFVGMRHGYDRVMQLHY
jgi:hypothetical protein